MHIVHRLSSLIVRLETFLGAGLGLLVTALILLNVVTRSLGNALFWVDEAAISAMVWMAFLGASVSLHHRQAVAVTLLPDHLPSAGRRFMGKMVDIAILIFGVILLVLTWRWFDPLTLMRNGFDTRAFSSETFNFVYAETTTTLGVRKFWLWLIMPIFSVNVTVHALSNLLQQQTTEATAPQVASQTP